MRHCRHVESQLPETHRDSFEWEARSSTWYPAKHRSRHSENRRRRGRFLRSAYRPNKKRKVVRVISLTPKSARPPIGVSPRELRPKALTSCPSYAVKPARTFSTTNHSTTWGGNDE